MILGARLFGFEILGAGRYGFEILGARVCYCEFLGARRDDSKVLGAGLSGFKFLGAGLYGLLCARLYSSKFLSAKACSRARFCGFYKASRSLPALSGLQP